MSKTMAETRIKVEFISSKRNLINFIIVILFWSAHKKITALSTSTSSVKKNIKFFAIVHEKFHN